MKQVKLLIAILAVVFSSASAFTPHAKFASLTYSYISGNVTNPTSYELAASSCSGNKTLCQVKVQEGTNGQPDNTALDALWADSGHFGTPGTYAHGVVIFKGN